MSAMTTSAPARPSVSASSRPRPREPPVTSATRPERSISSPTKPEPNAAGINSKASTGRFRRPTGKAGRPEDATASGASVPWKQEFSGDHEALDLRGALVDLVQLGVPHQLLDRVLLHVAVAAENLDGVGRDLHADVGREPLRIAGLQRRAHALIDHPRGLPAEQARRLDLGRHVGDQEVDSLVHGDRHPELDALLRVLRRILEGRASDADGADGSGGAREVECLHRDLETVALPAEPVGGGHLYGLEGEGGRVGRALAHLVEMLLDNYAVEVRG